MLEILALWLLTKRIGGIVGQKGHILISLILLAACSVPTSVPTVTPIPMSRSMLTSTPAISVRDEIIPPQIYSYIEKNLDIKFSDAIEKAEYIKGFNAGFKSSLVNKIPYLTEESGSKMFDEGFKTGREIGLAEPVPDELKDVNLRDYGFTDVSADGFLYVGFEQSDFRPINSDKVWRVLNSDMIGNNPVYRKIQGKRKGSDAYFDRLGVYAKIKGYYGTRGVAYVGAGWYEREIYIAQILEIRESTVIDRLKRKDD